MEGASHSTGLLGKKPCQRKLIFKPNSYQVSRVGWKDHKIILNRRNGMKKVTELGILKAKSLVQLK